jgi:hypothetical protein
VTCIDFTSQHWGPHFLCVSIYLCFYLELLVVEGAHFSRGVCLVSTFLRFAQLCWSCQVLLTFPSKAPPFCKGLCSNPDHKSCEQETFWVRRSVHLVLCCLKLSKHSIRHVFSIYYPQRVLLILRMYVYVLCTECMKWTQNGDTVSLRLFHLWNYWTDFGRIWNWGLTLRAWRTNSVLISVQNKPHFTRWWSRTSSIFSKMTHSINNCPMIKV